MVGRACQSNTDTSATMLDIQSVFAGFNVAPDQGVLPEADLLVEIQAS